MCPREPQYLPGSPETPNDHPAPGKVGEPFAQVMPPPGTGDGLGFPGPQAWGSGFLASCIFSPGGFSALLGYWRVGWVFAERGGAKGQAQALEGRSHMQRPGEPPGGSL